MPYFVSREAYRLIFIPTIFSILDFLSWPFIAKVSGAVTAAAGVGFIGYYVWKKRFARSSTGDEGFAEASEARISTYIGLILSQTKFSDFIKSHTNFISRHANVLCKFFERFTKIPYV